MDMLSKCLCFTIVLQVINCEMTADLVFETLSGRLNYLSGHLSLSLTKLSRKQNALEKRLEEITDQINNDDGRSKHASGYHVGNEINKEMTALKKAISSEKEYLRNLVDETISAVVETRIEPMQTVTNEMTTRMSSLENGSNKMSSNVEAVQRAASELTTQLSSMKLSAIQLESVQATSSAMSTKLTVIETTSNTMATKLESLETASEAMASSMESLKRDSDRKVSFTVKLKHPDHYEVLKKSTIVKFNHAYHNDGGGYDMSTGKFTAPETGVYQFIYFVEGWQDVDDFVCRAAVVSLYVNGSQRTAAIAEPRHKSQLMQSGNALISYVEKGQDVWVQTDTSCEQFIITSYRTTFSGVLLY